jgi:hypothetical protein
MEGQRTEALSGLSEQVLAVATNAITNAINAKIIAKAVDTDAITDAITAGLKEIRFTNEAVMQASIMGDKIGVAVAGAVKSAMAALVPKATMDATAMREQTLGSLPRQSAHSYELTESTQQISKPSMTCSPATCQRICLRSNSLPDSTVSKALSRLLWFVCKSRAAQSKPKVRQSLSRPLSVNPPSKHSTGCSNALSSC